MMIGEKSVQRLARFIFATLSTGGELLLPAAVPDEAVCTAYEKTGFRTAAHAMHVFRLKLLSQKPGIKLRPLFCSFLSQYVVIVSHGNEYRTFFTIQSAIAERWCVHIPFTSGGRF
jgi:hypothetical protein